MVFLWGGWLHPFVLGGDGSDPIFQRISLEVEHFVEVGLLKDWFADHPVLEFFEGSLLAIFPMPWCGLFREV